MGMEREPGRSGSYFPALARAMTSVTQLEIIDLTESSPPFEKGKETFDSPDDGTHADPEKSVAKPPSSRKHKNGEIGKAHGTPARSRDGSLERGHAPSLEEISVQLEEGGRGSIGESARRKKRSPKKSKGKNKETDTSPPSREDTQKDRLDDEQLFFIDTAPAPVPAGMTFDLKSADDASAHTVPLLLPAHVSVLDPGDGFPVKIIEREDSDSGSESYIEYLDYEDRLVRIP
jgi:protein AIR1/2